MFKRLSITLGVISALACAITSCGQKTPAPEPEPTAPVASITVSDLSRTSITFKISSDAPGDYAWAIVPAGQTIETAEDLFGPDYNNGMFDDSNIATVTYNQLEGNKEYTLYYAVRKINPYVYSEIKSEEVSTVSGYESMITLEKATPTAVSYHIEMPEGAEAYRHMIVDYNDYLYFKALVGVTHDSYLSAFGLGADKSQTFEYEWKQLDGWDNYATYFYSDTKYLILAGKSESAAIDSKVSAADVKVYEFTTPKAEKCPYDVDITVSDVTSITAKVTLTPEEGVDKYRAFIMSEADYEAFLFEGEEMVRRAVIGPWEDKSSEFYEAQEFSLQGLVPESNYYVCIVAFDKDMREVYIEDTFTTTEPTGPVPEIETTEVDVEEPWNSAAVNLKIRNATSAIAFVHTKQAVDEVLDAPGNEDLTMDVVIRNNGVAVPEDVLSKALTEEGASLMFSNLSPNTEYVYAVLATNIEHVSTAHVYNFTTSAEPTVETGLFDKLKGEYTAQITDVYGVPHTFDVTITDGVNDATRESYKAQNILVCLGFDPCGVEYHSPQDLLDKGWAKTEEEANRNYGPKWFLEIDENDKITTYKHALASSSYDSVNDVTLYTYSAEGEDPMASFNDQTIWFKGTFNRYYASKDRYEQQSTTLIHDVDYDEESGTITVEPVKHYKIWSAKGEMITEYPGVSQSKSWHGGSDSKVIFCGNSALVLTPKATAAKQSCGMEVSTTEIKIPSRKTLNVQETRRILRPSK